MVLDLYVTPISSPFFYDFLSRCYWKSLFSLLFRISNFSRWYTLHIIWDSCRYDPWFDESHRYHFSSLLSVKIIFCWFSSLDMLCLNLILVCFVCKNRHHVISLAGKNSDMTWLRLNNSKRADEVEVTSLARNAMKKCQQSAPKINFN